MHKKWPILNIRPCQHNLWEGSGASQSWRGCGDHQKGRKVEKIFKHKTLKILKSIHIKLLSDQGQSCHFPAKFWNERISRFQVSLQAHQSEKQSKILLWYPSDDIKTWNGLKFDCHWVSNNNTARNENTIQCLWQDLAANYVQAILFSGA